MTPHATDGRRARITLGISILNGDGDSMQVNEQIVGYTTRGDIEKCLTHAPTQHGRSDEVFDHPSLVET